MRVVFMGTPGFAVPSLRALAALHDVTAAFTRPDAVSGRGGATRATPVKQAAAHLGIAVHQPSTLRDPAVVEELRSLAPDAIVVAAYGLILPAQVLEIPPFGCLNVHASLLPRWRGAAPIQRAILAGDLRTGVSIMRMEEGLDTGAFCVTRSTEVADKNAEDLASELALLGADALVEALDRIWAGTCQWVEQDDRLVTYAEKISKQDVALGPELAVSDALRRVRASSSQAPARVRIGERSATVVAASPSDLPLAPGAIACTKRALVLGFSDGSVLLDRVRPDGKSAMAGCDWARGARFNDGDSWESAS